jgi:hypothetical protein
MFQDGPSDNLHCVQQIGIVTESQSGQGLSHQPRDKGTVAELGMTCMEGKPVALCHLRLL